MTSTNPCHQCAHPDAKGMHTCEGGSAADTCPCLHCAHMRLMADTPEAAAERKYRLERRAWDHCRIAHGQKCTCTPRPVKP